MYNPQVEVVSTTERGIVEINVLVGDITHADIDAIVTTTSLPDWPGITMTDSQVCAVAGNRYHEQLAETIASEDLSDPYVIRTLQGKEAHAGAFKEVLFVYDSLEKSLSDVVIAGLNAADMAGCKRVAIPFVRERLDPRVDGSLVQRAEAIVRAINEHAKRSDIQSVTIVAQADSSAAALRYALSETPQP